MPKKDNEEAQIFKVSFKSISVLSERAFLSYKAKSTIYCQLSDLNTNVRAYSS